MMTRADMPPTPSQTVGPFFGFALPHDGWNQVVADDTPGAIRVEGQVFDGAGTPVPDALVEIWQAAPDGSYAQRAGSGFGGFGRCPTDSGGWYWFVTLKPGPISGPDGTLQAPHLNVTVLARGLLRHLVTRMYFPDEEQTNANDPLLGLLAPDERATLIARATDADGKVLRFDVHLQGERETVFYAI